MKMEKKNFNLSFPLPNCLIIILKQAQNDLAGMGECLKEASVEEDGHLPPDLVEEILEAEVSMGAGSELSVS